MLNYLFPQTIEVLKSKFNGEIKIVKLHNKISVWVGGFQQSGPLVEKIWESGLAGFYPANVLILGLGCGSIVKFLPHSKITGVEIDPVMIRLGRKYFHLDKVNIICGDALTLKFKETFDLIIVDLYKGGKMQKLIVPTDYLTKNGIIIYNQSTFGKDKVDLLSYLDKNPLVNVKEIKKFEYNKLIFCSKK
ncbi:MAG: methyltransferase domain-containing protein [bacterium]|nr:methyltransferase domain-containing protein [bacterium]